MVLIETLFTVQLSLVATVGIMRWAESFDRAVTQEYRAMTERKWTCQKTR